MHSGNTVPPAFSLPACMRQSFPERKTVLTGSTAGDPALSGGAWKELHGAPQASAATETMPGAGEQAIILREEQGIGKKECAFGSTSVPLSVEACGSPGGRRARPFNGISAAPWLPHSGGRPGRRKQCRPHTRLLPRRGTGLPVPDAPAWRSPAECARGSWCGSHSR